MKIFDEVIDVLRKKLTQKQWIEFGQSIEACKNDEFLGKVDVVIQHIAPENSDWYDEDEPC